MAGCSPNVFYLVQRNEVLAAEIQRQANIIHGLVQQEQQLREGLRQKEREVHGLVQQKQQLREGLGEKEREVVRLREQLLEKDQQIQELGARPRKRARAEDVPEVEGQRQAIQRNLELRQAIQRNLPLRASRQLNPWSSLKKRQLQNKKTMLREDFVEPSFDNLPDNVVKANVNFRTDDGISIDVEWPQGPNDRRGQPPPGDRSPKGRGYRHQTEETKDLVKWCVHFKDQATVSDVWWHELHMKFKDTIPPIGWMKQERGEQNSFIPYQLEENARDGNGASRSVADIIKHHLTMPANQHLLQGEEPVVSFRYGLDGRPQAKNNIIGAVMACITPVRSLAEAQKHPRTVKEEYCVFLYSGKEDYEEQVRVGARVFREMEDIQENGVFVEIEGVQKHVRINWYVVSDWKALAIMMGLVGPTGDYFCVLCYCNKENIAHFRQGFDLRTHEKAQMHYRDRRNQCGHKHLPVFKIPWGNIIIDTLHTFLRIGGKLLNQFISWTIDQGRTAALEKAMSDIGVNFYIRKEGTTQGPDTYKWKTLTAKELKTVIKSLPDHMSAIINDIGNTGQISIDALQGPQAAAVLRSMNQSVPWRNAERIARLKRLLGEDAMVTLPNRHVGDDDGQTEIRVADIMQLWKDFSKVTDMQRHPELNPGYKEAATSWCERFRDTTYIEDITPYIHYFGAHAGDQMAAHPFLHYVNCETIEKKNHVQTRRYHLATQKGGGRYKSKWAEQLMQMENRDTFAAMHGIGERKKRPWGQNRVQEDEDDNSSDTGFSDNDSDPEPPETPEPDVDEDDNRVVYDGDQDDL
ncbi:uncharacterized protein [Branchiostoma lanceolatum]|uniref:Hypp8719 protein n=1 Tax=Branchiostoma lanceolatum TaxID=7740 RepID=A0A8J9Z7V4_BRALA|nr:Hypp8719 [Branchiostoma lanceolatum]